MGETKDAKGRWLATGAVGTVVVGFVAMLYASFADGMRAARARLERLGSRVVETECGPIEYATYGEGPPVLMVHGIFGGFDQGLVFARGILGERLHSIVPTRFGYLRTPMPHGASPASQADAHACLLDALGVERVAVVGTSSGAASAIQFALRHRERCGVGARLFECAGRDKPHYGARKADQSGLRGRFCHGFRLLVAEQPFPFEFGCADGGAQGVRIEPRGGSPSGRGDGDPPAR